MKYSMTLNEALTYHSPVKIYAFMFYAQPGVRDIAILEQGMSGLKKFYIFSLVLIQSISVLTP